MSQQQTQRLMQKMYQEQASLRKQLRCKLTDMKVQNDLIDTKLLKISLKLKGMSQRSNRFQKSQKLNLRSSSLVNTKGINQKSQMKTKTLLRRYQSQEKIPLKMLDKSAQKELMKRSKRQALQILSKYDMLDRTPNFRQRIDGHNRRSRELSSRVKQLLAKRVFLKRDIIQNEISFQSKEEVVKYAMNLIKKDENNKENIEWTPPVNEIETLSGQERLLTDLTGFEEMIKKKVKINEQDEMPKRLEELKRERKIQHQNQKGKITFDDLKERQKVITNRRRYKNKKSMNQQLWEKTLRDGYGKRQGMTTSASKRLFALR